MLNFQGVSVQSGIIFTLNLETEYFIYCLTALGKLRSPNPVSNLNEKIFQTKVLSEKLNLFSHFVRKGVFSNPSTGPEMGMFQYKKLQEHHRL